MTMTPPERSASSPSSYYLPAIQPRTSSYPMQSSYRHERNSTSSSTIHPTIANLVTPTRASTSPINKASSSPASFYKAYTPIVANYTSTTPEREIPRHETPQRHHHYLNYRYDDTIEEISDESESMMDHCEPQRGWSTSSSRQTNSPSPVMAPADLHKLSLHDQPYGAQDSSHRHHSQFQHRAQPPLSRHHYKKHPKEHGHSILLPSTNIPEQDCNMEVESQEPNLEADSQPIPSRTTIAVATNTNSSTTATYISKPNPKRPSKEKRKQPKPIRAATMPVRPSHYEQMSDAQKRLYDHHPRSPEYDDNSEEDEVDEDSSAPASPRSFSSMSQSPPLPRRIVTRSDEQSSKDDLGPGPAQNFHTSNVRLSYHSNYQPQSSYGSRYQTTPHISQNHYQKQHPYHHPDPFHSKRSSYGSPQFPHQKLLLDSQPWLYTRHIPQQQQLPMRKYRRQHRPRQLLQQSLHAAGSLDGYPYAAAPLTGSSISSTGSSSCSSMPALSPTDSFFLSNTTLSPPSGHGSHSNIPHLPGTEGMTVVRNEDGSIMVYNPATDAMTFRCELCPLESFGRIHDLKRHQTSKHQEMTWPCDYCHRPFVRRDALLRHYTVKAARDDGIHPASHEVEKLLEARARAKMLY
ncbi:hypothetical protein BGZ82_002816 [Podila clonocystis]|nr:hypothetical protein BGZ82_002816 [Podila clonocystis]